MMMMMVMMIVMIVIMMITGTYHLMTLAEYTRPNRVGYANQAANSNAPVKVDTEENILLELRKYLVYVCCRCRS